MRIIISDRNRKETSLKSELHSAQLQLRSTLNHHKIMREEAIILKKDFKVTILKKDFKQKDDKFLEEFLDIKRLKEKSAPYNGHVLVMTNHTPTVVHDSEDTREIAEITKKRMMEKMKSPLCVENKVRIAPQITRMRNLTLEQIFWSIDENDRKKDETSVPKPLSALTVITPTGVTEGERDLEAEMSKVHNESKHISKLERENINLQLKYQHLQESFDNNKSQTSQEAPDFNSFFKIKNLEHQIQEKDNVIRDLKVLVSNVNDRSCEPCNANDVTALIEQNECVRVELEEVKQHYKELFESIQLTRASTNEKTSSLLTQIEDLKAQLEGNLKVAARSSVKTKVLAPGMYAIDVEPIPPRLKNNRNAHLTYINHLKESVETVREIVEEARVVKPLDNKQEVHQKVQQTNVPAIHSTGVNTSTRASGSKPRSNTKQNRILPAKSVNNKKVKDHPRTNKSVWTKVNRVDSSISSKHVNGYPTVKIVLNKGKQIWKPKGKLSDNSLNKTKQIWQPKGKLSDNSLNKTKQVWKATGKLFANVGYQWRPTGNKFTSGKLNCGYQWRPTGKKFTLGELCPLTRLSVTCCSKLDLEEWMAPVRISSGTEPFMMTLGQLNSGLAPSHVPATTNIPPTYKDLEILFQPMFDEYFEQSTDGEPVPTATVVNAPIVSTNTSVSTTIAQDAPSTSHSLSSSQVHPPVFPQGVAAGPTIKDTSITQADLHPSVNPVAGEPSSAQSTSGDVSLTEPKPSYQPNISEDDQDHPP
ncbi:hypothetical protein Tco_0642636 [Tanacetum coccineum]